MADTSSTTTFRADISSLRAEMQAASRAVQVANSEFKAATAGMDAWSASADGLEAKIKQLDSVLAAQNRQIALAEEELKKTAQEYGENSAATDRARVRYNNFKAAAAETEKQLEQYKGELKTVGSETEKVGEAAAKAGEGFTVFKGMVANLAASAIKQGIRAMKEFAEETIRVGASFEKAMSEVSAISGASGADLDKMSAKAKELGATTKFTASQVAEGFKYMSLAGWSTAESLEAIDGVINLAAASEMDLGQASDMVTDYLAAFGLEAQDAAQMVDELVYAQSHSNTSTEQLGEAFKNSAANMNAADQSLETTVALLEAMANQGTKGSQAGTQLAAVMRDLTSKMKNGSIMIGDTAVAVQDQEGNFRDLVDIMADVEKATRGMGSAERASALQSTFTARSIKAVNQILNEGVDDIRGYKDALEDSGGAAAKTAQTMQDNFQGALTRAQSAIEGLQVALFDLVSSPITAVVNGFAKLTGAVADFLAPPEKTDIENYLTDLDGKIEQTREDLEGLGAIEIKANADISQLKAYRDVLEKATKGEELSEFEKYQLKQAVEELGGVIPGLAEAYDEERGAIDLTTESMSNLLDETEKQIRLAAYQEELEAAWKLASKAAVEAAEAESAYEAATKDLTEALQNAEIPQEVLDSWDLSTMDAGEIYNVAMAYGMNAQELMRLVTAQQEAQASAEAAAQAEKDAEKAAADRTAAIKKLEEAEEEENLAVEKNTGATMEDAAAERNAKRSKEEFVHASKEKTDAVEEETQAELDKIEAEKRAEGAAKTLTKWMGKATKEAASHSKELKGFFKEAGDNASKALTEKIERAADTERKALNTIREAYESNFESIRKTLSQKVSLWDVFSGGADVTVEQMLANLQTQTAGIQQYKEEMAAVIAEYGDELGPDLINTLQEMGTDAANTWHHMFVTMSQDNAPELFTQMGEEWAKGLDLSEQIAKYAAGDLTAYQVATNKMGSTKIEWTGLRESVQEMTPELDKVISAAEAAGVAIPDGLEEGLRSGETTTEDAISLLTKSLQGTFEGLYEIAEQSGADIPEGLSSGMEGSAEEYQAAIKSLTESLSNAGNEAGTAAAEEISTGLSNNTDQVETAAESTAGAAADAADNASSDFKAAGESAGAEFSKGIRSKSSVALSAGKALAQAAVNGVAGVDMTNSGRQFAQGYINGINSLVAAVAAKAREMVRNAINAAKAAQQEGSPSKLTYQSGRYFTQGYILGIAADEKKLIRTVQGLVNTAVKQLAKVSNYDFKAAGEKAGNDFSEAFEKQADYMVSKMTYINQSKLEEFDDEIARLQAQRDAAINKAESASDKKIAALEKKKSKAKKKSTKEKYQKQIDAEKNAIKKQTDSIEKQYEALISTQEKYQKAYQTASQEMISRFQSALNEYRNAAEDLIESVISGITGTYESRYDELISKQESLIEKLKDSTELFKVTGAGVMIVADIEDQTRQIKEYTDQLRAVKDKVSAELFDEIAKYDVKEGTAYMNRLLGMTEAELSAYNEAYTRKLQAAADAAEVIYGDDIQKVADDYQAEIQNAFKDLPKQLEELGQNAMKGFLEGFASETDYMSQEIRTFISGMIDTFKQQLQISSPSKVTMELGEYTGEGFVDGIMSMIKKAKTAAAELASVVSTPLDVIDTSMIQGAVPMGGGSSMSVVNNYNLVQNNNSPKSLSALETYQARRRQIAMIEAFS